jgi:hypothetical protein
MILKWVLEMGIAISWINLAESRVQWEAVMFHRMPEQKDSCAGSQTVCCATEQPLRL